MTTITDLTNKLATELDLDEAYVADSLTGYLAQMSQLDGIEYDADDLDEETAEFLEGAMRSEVDTARPDLGTAMEHLEEAAQRWQYATAALEDARQIRTTAAREARAAGATQEDVRVAGRFGALSQVRKVLAD